MYAPNNKAPKYVRPKLTELRGEIDKSTIIVTDSNTPHSVFDRSSRQEVNKLT